jgi:hypothetical protein
MRTCPGDTVDTERKGERLKSLLKTLTGETLMDIGPLIWGEMAVVVE